MLIFTRTVPYVKLKANALSALMKLVSDAHLKMVFTRSIASVCLNAKPFYGVSLNLSLGYSVVSLMFFLPVNTMVNLSRPMAQPACGGIP
jgi:hypothetical protein